MLLQQFHRPQDTALIIRWDIPMTEINQKYPEFSMSPQNLIKLINVKYCATLAHQWQGKSCHGMEKLKKKCSHSRDITAVGQTTVKTAAAKKSGSSSLHYQLALEFDFSRELKNVLHGRRFTDDDEVTAAVVMDHFDSKTTDCSF